MILPRGQKPKVLIHVVPSDLKIHGPFGWLSSFWVPSLDGEVGSIYNKVQITLKQYWVFHEFLTLGVAKTRTIGLLISWMLDYKMDATQCAQYLASQKWSRPVLNFARARE